MVQRQSAQGEGFLGLLWVGGKGRQKSLEEFAGHHERDLSSVSFLSACDKDLSGFHSLFWDFYDFFFFDTTPSQKRGPRVTP